MRPILRDFPRRYINYLLTHLLTYKCTLTLVYLLAEVRYHNARIITITDMSLYFINDTRYIYSCCILYAVYHTKSYDPLNNIIAQYETAIEYRHITEKGV